MRTFKATLSWCHEETDYLVDVSGYVGYAPRGWDPGDPGEMDVLRVYVDAPGPRQLRPDLEEAAHNDDALWVAFQEEAAADPDDPPDPRDDR
jgi:hypothetical protein